MDTSDQIHLVYTDLGNFYNYSAIRLPWTVLSQTRTFVFELRQLNI